MSLKDLFSRSLAANPERLHFAAHSHHLWPDASFDAQIEAWDDAARFADSKWDRIIDEIWPEAQTYVSCELGTGDPNSVAFSTNTHDFVVRLLTAAPHQVGERLKVLTTDGEFHSARRQLARWEEEDVVVVERISAEPFDTFPVRFLEAASAGRHDVIFVSQVLFGSGRIFDRLPQLAALGRPEGPWVIIDGYHAFMALDCPFGSQSSNSAFYLGGGYKYAMAGEGSAFLHAPVNFGPRPPVTGWFAEFEDLSLPQGRVGYASDARRFLGATFDPSGLYRFVGVQRMLKANGLTTARISEYTAGLQQAFLERVAKSPLAQAELLNPLTSPSHARFLAFRSEHAERWSKELKASRCVTDVRSGVLRIGFAIYQDENDVERLASLVRGLS